MKIVIYGTGNLGKYFYKNIAPGLGTVEFFAETIPGIEQIYGKQVISCAELAEVEFDVIFIASRYIDDISCELKKNKIADEKCIYLMRDKIGISQRNGIWEYSIDENKDEWISFAPDVITTNSYSYMRYISEDVRFSDFWIGEKDYVTEGISALLEKNQNHLIKEKMLPHLNKLSVVCDLPCADGNYSEMLAPYVKHVDGFDYSQSLIDSAVDRALKKNIENIIYKRADACTIEFDKKYDGFLEMALFLYIENDEDVKNIIHKIYNTLNDDSYVFVKESLHEMSEKIYGMNIMNGYLSVYRVKEEFEKWIVDAGFDIVDRFLIADDISLGCVDKKSYGYLLRR